MKREPFILAARGGHIHDGAGVAIAYAPDEDMLTARANWRHYAPTLAAAAGLANALEEAERLTREGNLFELRRFFKSARMQNLFNVIRKEI